MCCLEGDDRVNMLPCGMDLQTCLHVTFTCKRGHCLPVGEGVAIANIELMQSVDFVIPPF